MFKTLAPLLLVLGLTSANAQIISAKLPMKLPTPLGNIVPVIMPGVSIIPMSLPTVDAEIVTPVRMPTFIEAPIPMSLPSRPVPVNGRIILPGVPSPLPLPTVIAVAARPQKPALAFNALNEMRDSAIGREPIRVNAGDVFDGRRESARTDAKFF